MSKPTQIGLFAYVNTGTVSTSGWQPVQMSANGSLSVAVVDAGGNSAPVLELNTDAIPESDKGLASASFNYGFNGISWDRLVSSNSNGDGVTPLPLGILQTGSLLYGFDGAAFDRIRIANVFKTIVATAAGSTAVWTPASGKKFRLMGYTIDVAGTIAATGVQALTLLDNATVIRNHLAEVIETTTVSIASSTTNIGADLGQGQLSAIANNVLSITLSEAMVTGGVAVNAWGTEE